MKSRITIDLDDDNQPIIKIEYSYSPDVRDTMVKKFMETFENTTSWAKVTCCTANWTGGVINNKDEWVAKIRPLPIKKLCDERDVIDRVVDKYEDILKQL